MQDNISKLEFLPNELILEVFHYCDTHELLRAFHNLNTRFDHLIQSVNNLSLTVSKLSDNDKSNYARFFPSAYTLTIDYALDGMKLHRFVNVHHLIVDYATNELLIELNHQSLPHLERLSIYRRVHPNYSHDLCKKIFTNSFPCLTSCYLSKMIEPDPMEKWTQSLSLRCLNLNAINSFMYISILSACPNLSCLKFKLLHKSIIKSNSVVHTNLKELIINMHYDNWPWDDDLLQSYVMCVPNLERFRIYRSILGVKILECFGNYDWFSSVIANHLLSLRQLKFDLYVSQLKGLTDFDLKTIFQLLQENFSDIHHGRYPARLKVH